MLRRFIQSEDAQLPLCGQACGRFFGSSGILVLGVAVLGLAGCSPTPEPGRVHLPVTPVISFRPRWAVAADLYVQVRAEPSFESAIRGHLRFGDVAEIVTISTVGNDLEGPRNGWYEVEVAGLRGWAVGDALEFYGSRSRASNAAGSFGVRRYDAGRQAR